MSQAECLRCIINLGGSAWHDDLTDEYNKIHFPRNIDYKQLGYYTVNKTMATDLAKLLRDGLIARTYKHTPIQEIYFKANHNNNKSLYHGRKKSAFYSITELGRNYVNRYNIMNDDKTAAVILKKKKR